MKYILIASILLSTLVLSACGQRGALMMPDDNYDKRPKYLIYKGNRQNTAVNETPASADVSH